MKKEKILITVYITKYALTSGIIEANLHITEDGYAHGKPPGWDFNSFFSPKDFFISKDQALNDCEARRIKKIEALKKQIFKLENKKFS